MGNAWSKFQSSKACIEALDCSKPSSGLTSAAGGAGIGVLLAFALSAGVNVLLSMIVILSQWNNAKNSKYERLGKGNDERFRRTNHERFGTSDLSQKDRERGRWRDQQQERTKTGWVMQQLILNFSDQQLVTGLAMAVTTRFFPSCKRPVSAYHYDLICYLLLCSVVTHLCSIVAVNQYFDPFSGSKRGTLSRLVFLVIRCVGIFVSIVLTGLILFDRDRNRFPVEPPLSQNDPDKFLLRPAACYFVGADNVKEIAQSIPETFKGWNSKNWSHGLIQYVIFLLALFVATPVAIFQSVYHAARRGKPARNPVLFVRLVVVLVGFVVFVWNITLAWNLRQWIHKAGWLDDGADTENAWTFSQILTLFVIFFAPFTLCDALAEKYDAKKRIEALEDHIFPFSNVPGATAPGEAIGEGHHSGW